MAKDLLLGETIVFLLSSEIVEVVHRKQYDDRINAFFGQNTPLKFAGKTSIRANYTMLIVYIGNENIGVSNVSQFILLSGFCFNNDIKRYFVCEPLRLAVLENNKLLL